MTEEGGLSISWLCINNGKEKVFRKITFFIINNGENAVERFERLVPDFNDANGFDDCEDEMKRLVLEDLQLLVMTDVHSINKIGKKICPLILPIISKDTEEEYLVQIMKILGQMICRDKLRSKLTELGLQWILIDLLGISKN